MKHTAVWIGFGVAIAAGAALVIVPRTTVGDVFDGPVRTLMPGEAIQVARSATPPPYVPIVTDIPQEPPAPEPVQITQVWDSDWVEPETRELTQEELTRARGILEAHPLMKEKISRFRYEIQILSPSILTDIRPGVLMLVVLTDSVAATEFEGDWPYVKPDSSLPIESRQGVLHLANDGSFVLADYFVKNFTVKVDFATNTLFELLPSFELWPVIVPSSTSVVPASTKAAGE